MEWIEVEKKKPPKDHRILCSDKEGWITTGWYTGDKFEYTDGEEPGLDITHWMPLPRSPMEI